MSTFLGTIVETLNEIFYTEPVTWQWMLFVLCWAGTAVYVTLIVPFRVVRWAGTRRAA